MKSEKKNKKNSKSEILSGIIFLCLGIIAISIIFPKFYNGNFDEYEKTTATVTSVDDKNGEIETLFTYEFKGKNYTGKSNQFKNSYEGEKFEIFVDPNLPTNIFYQNDLNRLLVMLRLGSICIIAISLFFAIKDKSKLVFS